MWLLCIYTFDSIFFLSDHIYRLCGDRRSRMFDFGLSVAVIAPLAVEIRTGNFGCSLELYSYIILMIKLFFFVSVVQRRLQLSRSIPNGEYYTQEKVLNITQL